MSDDRSREQPAGANKGPAEDTEGQNMHWSNRDLKKDVKPVEPKPADDTEGQNMHWSNRDLKKDVKPVEPKPAQDTEGQSMSRTSIAAEEVFKSSATPAEDTEGQNVRSGG